MSFIAFTPGEIDADSPLTETFFTKMSDNFDALDGADVTNGDLHNHEGGDGAELPQTALAAFVAGDLSISRHKEGEIITATSYTFVRRLRVSRAGTIRTVFTLTGFVLEDIYGKIYKNGSPVGFERHQSGAGTTIFLEDFTVALGDTIELWCHVDAGDVACSVSDFKLNNAYYIDSVMGLNFFKG